MTTADIHALTGAYVLDAIPELERAAFERHLAECEACVQEVAELQATATRLGEAAAEPPPPRLKFAVMAQIGNIRQVPPLGADGVAMSPPARNPWPVRIFGLAAAVMLVISVSMGIALYNTQSNLEDTRTQAAATSEILSAGDAQVVTGTSNGMTGTVVYSRDSGDVLLIADGVPAAPEGKVYQAWLMGEGPPFHSVGLIKADKSGHAAIIDTTGTVASAQAVGLTVEPAGGSEQPSTDPFMTVNLD